MEEELADAGAPIVSELLAIKASRSSAAMFPVAAAAAAAAARSCFILRPKALLSDA